MFANCNASLWGFEFLSEWDVSNVTSMAGMFYDSLGYFYNLGNWDVSNVTDMSFMFSESQIGDISNLGLENWDVSNLLIWELCLLRLVYLVIILKTGM